MDKAISYLKDRVESININHPKAHPGCRLLYYHTDRLKEVIDVAIYILVRKSSMSSTDSPRGTAKLMATAHSIGKGVAEELVLGDLWPEDHIRVGVLILEALQNAEESIKIMRDPLWDGHKLRAPYIIILNEGMFELMEEVSIGKDWSDMPIPRVSKLIQANNRPLIKHWGEDKERGFQQLLKRDPAFVKGADVLQRTGWRINRDVYQYIMDKYYDDFVPAYVKPPREDDPEWILAVRQNSKSTANRITLRKAEELLDKDFYQYVSFDFRGRVYYQSAFLNYQGSDLSRGILEFSEGKKLGNRGLYWLAVHTASSYNESYGIDEIPEWCEGNYREYLENQGLSDISVDKMTLNDRMNWTFANMERILFNGSTGVVKDCEKPVVFLACALEWLKISDFQISGKDPKDFVSHLPIPVDGANNGWQHLGAMSKDKHTGALVGLTNVDIPNDFYVKTAQNLKARMPEWFDSRGMPMKHIRKGIAKRGSMTKAYSAGIKKVAENMWADVVKEGFHDKYNITEADCMVLSVELDAAIREVCPGPLQTMKFLQNLANHELNTVTGAKINWTTPSGFPVIQEYLIDRDIKIRCTIAPPKNTLFPFELGGSVKVDGKVVGYNGEIKLSGIVFVQGVPKRGKAASAISPNFVHSMDASHMALLLAQWEGRPFGAVHDSFSAHAADIDELLDITKSTFVSMYNVDNFFDVMKDMILTDPEGFDSTSPELGELELQEIHDVDFFFA